MIQHGNSLRQTIPHVLFQYLMLYFLAHTRYGLCSVCIFSKVLFVNINVPVPQADFFRYLVLFQEGGIYVDVDVMLNTNLDTFLTPDLGFFAPLDAVGSFADEKFCLCE